MEILITNDDGWQAKGIQTLARLMQTIGHVTVVAPDGARSGQSNAITIQQPIRLRKVLENANITAYTTNGTPSDCVKLALNVIYKGGKPDLVVSGINHGSNAAINVIYSGTMGAAFVAAEHGIPAIGFSLCDHHPDADFSAFEPYIIKLTRQIISASLPYGTCININAPVGEIQGVRLTRQCIGHWEKELKEYTDPHGEPFYMLVGEFINHEPEAEDTDEWALKHGYIALTPNSIDLTDYKWIDSTNIGLEH
ncbi:MAG: 5'/3'-nucleotidase SurE [Paludibacter sp.]|nr:5'/3'-nucleotidase SurE [Bacteroidales bacterium]MCM1068756.1 5'/3'-nucleotidase SurE [Prevotella sp.]MCM1354468.1 5'/3'-nucleotidase SurE [Bacteroides sp.]MCM1443271.1 5'/3'-nucleotidase SurE [Muribaculum sp.]MCM1481044.1 5'/3'-nucleotidase SurE [Paludibacter sp.]